MDDLVRRVSNLRIKKYKKPQENLDSPTSYKPGRAKTNRKMFGYYRCKECKRNWQSAHSWEGFRQKCKGCGKETLSYYQEELQNSGENKIDLKKPHEKNLCEKCKEVGDCTQL